MRVHTAYRFHTLTVEIEKGPVTSVLPEVHGDLICFHDVQYQIVLWAPSSQLLDLSCLLSLWDEFYHCSKIVKYTKRCRNDYFLIKWKTKRFFFHYCRQYLVCFSLVLVILMCFASLTFQYTVISETNWNGAGCCII